jgi:trimeric autotransporter adhesin
VTFKPTANGTRSAALSVTDNAAGSPQQVPLSGIGTTAKLSPTSLNFGTVAIGVTSAAKTVTLINVGTTTLTISGIAITGTNAGDFAQTHTCGTSLAASASCTISIKFKPTASGTRTAALIVTDNAAGSPQQVPLSGIGTTAKLSPTSLNFGSVTVGVTSAAKTVTLTNVGTTTLAISGIAITGTNAGDFSQTHTCGSSLAAGASCTISVKFKPSARGARSAALGVSDNAAGSPQKVALSGTGL